MLCEDEADRESSTESSLEALSDKNPRCQYLQWSVQDHSLGYFGESQGLWKKQHDC